MQIIANLDVENLKRHYVYRYILVRRKSFLDGLDKK